MAERTERTGEDKAPEMDAAGKQALEALRKLEAEPELKPGIDALRSWWKDSYLKAGHKRLAKALLGKLED